jgi:histidinol-phosphate aminotransferase
LSIDEIRERYSLPQVIKLASNENPLGTSPAVQKALQKTAGLAFRYPPAGNPRLCAVIAAHHGVPKDMVCVGNGSDEIIDLLIRVRAVPGTHNVVTCLPCFDIYSLQTRLAGVELRQVPVRDDFSFDWEGLLEAADEKTALVFLATPDNPSGYCPERSEVMAFAARLPQGALLVLDEAYMDFVDHEASRAMIPFLAECPNAAVMRTFSKSFGLAGMRIGYGIMPAELADYVMRVRLPFSVNILAEEAAIAALSDTAFRRETLRAVNEGRASLTASLRELGCAPHPSQTNFIMFSLPPDSGYTAQNVFEALLTRGVIIRTLKSYGLADHLRVSVGNAMENKIFITALSQLLSQRCKGA